MKAFNFSVQKYTKKYQWSTQIQEISPFKSNGMSDKGEGAETENICGLVRILISFPVICIYAGGTGCVYPD